MKTVNIIINNNNIMQFEGVVVPLEHSVVETLIRFKNKKVNTVLFGHVDARTAAYGKIYRKWDDKIEVEVIRPLKIIKGVDVNTYEVENIHLT